MLYTAITHAGRAHIDEILALAVLAIHKGTLPAELQRIDSNEVAKMVAEDRIPNGTWVVDCGLVFDPLNRLFDHHHDANLPSSAILLFHHCIPELVGTELHRYFELVSKVDNDGLRSLDDFDLISESRNYWGFTHHILVSVFEDDPMAVLRLVTHGLRSRIRIEKKKEAASEWAFFPGRLKTENIDGITVLIVSEQPPLELFDALRSIEDNIIQEHGAAVVYGYDREDASIRTLYRTDIGHNLISFNLSKAQNTVFSHQGGFLLRFRPAEKDEWRSIIAASIIS